MCMFKFLAALFLFVCRVHALPLSRTSTGKTYCIPLVVLSVLLFLLLVAIKLVYMKQRRIGTIHAPPVPSSQGKETRRHGGLVVGCLGSPAWETNLVAKLNETAWQRRSSFARRDTLSTMRSTCTRTESTLDAPPCGHARTRSSRSLGSTSTCSACGDFGESRGLGFPGNTVAQGTRRASPSSIRLVDGPSHSNQVEYAFLSGLPPAAVPASPLTTTRDSIQLSRCSLKCDRKAVPPLPPLPPFLREDGHLFSPLVLSVAAKGTAPLRLVQPKCLTGNGKPLKSCLRQSAPSPISDDDLGMLGLDRFQWSEEIRERCSHMKQDSIVWVV